VNHHFQPIPIYVFGSKIDSIHISWSSRLESTKFSLSSMYL
jgi:hypothetical protein